MEKWDNKVYQVKAHGFLKRNIQAVMLHLQPKRL